MNFCEFYLNPISDFRNSKLLQSIIIMPLSGTASRFALLPDDEAADSKVLKKLEKQKKDEMKKNESNKQKDSSKNKAKNEAKELQNIAFGGGSGKKKNKKKNNQNKTQNGNNVESSQLEEWKERDKALVEDNFTADMQEAILQSQLEFEQQQSLVAAQQQLISSGVGSEEVLASLSKEERKKVVKQQKKPTTMSLDQFNSAQDQSTEQNGVEVRFINSHDSDDFLYFYFSRLPNLNLSCIDIHDIEKEQELELETVQRKMSRITTREQTSSTSWMLPL